MLRKLRSFLQPKMVEALKTSILYTEAKLEYSFALASKKLLTRQITRTMWWDTMCRNFLVGKMTYMCRCEGQEMAPAIPGQQEILLTWKLPYPDAEREWLNGVKWSRLYTPVPTMSRWGHTTVSIGDVVLVRSPLDPNLNLVRRVAALGGQELVSADGKAETLVIEEGHCWLLSDNQNLKAEEAKDSRTFGPIHVSKILGRVIYRFHTPNNHGIVENSKLSSAVDLAVLKFELELDELEDYSEPETPL